MRWKRSQRRDAIEEAVSRQLTTRQLTNTAVDNGTAEPSVMPPASHEPLIFLALLVELLRGASTSQQWSEPIYERRGGCSK
jgi:hypothetical protein